MLEGIHCEVGPPRRQHDLTSRDLNLEAVMPCALVLADATDGRADVLPPALVWS
jgi:hypothetical protein